MSTDTFPTAYYGKAATKITTTAATAILSVSAVSTGRGSAVTPVEVLIANEDGSNACAYTLEYFDGTVSYRIARATLAADTNAKLNFTGLVLTETEELRITAANANDLVCIVSFLQDLGGGGNDAG